MIAKEIGSGPATKLHINIDACHQSAIKIRKSLQIIAARNAGCSCIFHSHLAFGNQQPLNRSQALRRKFAVLSLYQSWPGVDRFDISGCHYL